MIADVVCRIGSYAGRTGRQVADLKENRPCPTCAQNYKAYQKKVQALEEKARLYEQRTFDLMVQNQGLVEKNQMLFEKSQVLFEKNQILFEKARKVSRQPSALEHQLAQIYRPLPH